MTTPTNMHNSATALKIQQDADPSANAAPALSQTEREMLEGQCQAERHRAGVFGQPAPAGAASARNGKGAGEPQAPAPTNAATGRQRGNRAGLFSELFADFCSDNVIYLSAYLPGDERLPERPAEAAALFARHNIEPLSAGICEPAPEDDDRAQESEHDTPVGDDIAEDDIAPQQHPGPGIVEQRAAENEQYLDRSVDPETLSIPLVTFPKLNRVIPQSETICAGWSAFVDAIAPTPAPVVPEKKDVPYVIAGTLQEAPLSKAAQAELHRVGKDAEIGKARSNKHIPSLGPAFLLDDDTVDGDVFDREARLRALGLAAFIYSSHSYGFGKMGGRVGVCLNRPYRPDEHKPLWYGISHLLGGGFDEAGQTLSQCYGIHARRSNNAPHKRVVLDGAALNVDALVALGRRLMLAKKAPCCGEP
jgi:hypothetical protein